MFSLNNQLLVDQSSFLPIKSFRLLYEVVTASNRVFFFFNYMTEATCGRSPVL